MVTSKGDIIIELNREKAPITVKNFLDYVDENSYDSTIFHRVISNFMIQGGGFNADMTKRPTKPEIKNEWGNDLQNLRGTIAMARRGGNIHSASNQFFINVKDNRNLDMKQSDGAGYAVFGKVIEGLDVVDIIKAVKTHRQAGHGDVPVEPVLILDVVRIEKP
ncbi:MAG: peptidylprolyl isomerase [candidate division Zixibacteria bacterium]|nr:peptidylprolyl isomerase [candidate division Zixibacteria bacterium]